MARTRCKVKAFHIYINGKFVSNSFGESTTQAIALYCKQYGIATQRGYKVGSCGKQYSFCARGGANGLYPCGSITKCKGICAVPTSIGLATAVPIE